MPVAEEKTLGPTQFLEYLGLLLNLLDLTLQIPEDKRVKNIEKIDIVISAFWERKTITCKEIQKVAGSLNFICAAIPAGKVFIADLYKLLRAPDGSKRKQGHHRRASLGQFMKICWCSVPSWWNAHRRGSGASRSWLKIKGSMQKSNCSRMQPVPKNWVLAVSLVPDGHMVNGLTLGFFKESVPT